MEKNRHGFVIGVFGSFVALMRIFGNETGFLMMCVFLKVYLGWYLTFYLWSKLRGWTYSVFLGFYSSSMKKSIS